MDGISVEDQALLERFQNWQSWSSDMLSQNRERWRKNIKLVKGIDDEKAPRSRVRKRSKLFFRKIWATGWRILASFYAAFLKDKDHFKIEGRDTLDDPAQAKVLQHMVEYRRDRMLRSQSLFIKFIWGMMDIIYLGVGVGKLHWVYDEIAGIDEPIFTLYPPEQVFFDVRAETKEAMRFCIFEDFMTVGEMEEAGYINIEDAEPETMGSNTVRSARYTDGRDPMQNPSENEYPRAGRYSESDQRDRPPQDFYRVWTVFYREAGVMQMAITNKGKAMLKDATPSPYGDRYPLVIGSCLLDPHKLIGEGFPQPLEGPQVSYNANMNQRKDNIALSLNKQTIVSRYGNVDLQSLVNSRPGGITLADDVEAVKEREIQDVTQSAYVEAGLDERMMDEMSGIVPIKQGLETAEKATVAQLNYTESNAKIDLYIAIVGETFMKDFYSTLAYLIQNFETDNKIFEVANTKMMRDRQFEGHPGNIFNINIEADVIVNVGMGTVGREIEIRQLMLAMDRAVMANQSMINLLQMGASPPEGVRLFDTTAFMEEILPKLGQKDLKKYFIQVQPPPQQGGPPGMTSGQGGQGIRGRATPQRGNAGILPNGGDNL